MLIDDFLAGPDPSLAYPGGTRVTDIHKPIRRRLQGAAAYVLDADAVAMAVGVSLSKPSSVLAALAFLRLPAEPTWIEWVPTDAREALQEMGSPNLAPADTQTFIERAGFLLRETEDAGQRIITIEYIHRDRWQNRQLTDAAPVIGTFAVPKDLPVDVGREAALSMRDFIREKGAKGRVRKSLERFEDPFERSCHEALSAAFSFEPHPDFAAVRMTVGGLAQAEKIEAAQAHEMLRMFMTIGIPSLLLLNTRNAVEAETVPAPEKLNKARRKKGRPPLVEHKVVRVSLTKGEKHGEDRAGAAAGRRPSRGTLVAGHFKVRKTGIYFWRPHARSGYGAVTRTTQVTG